MQRKKNYISNFNRALQWIDRNTIDGNGIAVSSKKQVIYPEVTGYYIPTLLQWGERERAIAYAKHLCSIQKEDGSWYDPSGSAPYVFDTAQILKGLLAIRKFLPEVDGHIKRGCDWILSNMQPDGRLTTPDKGAWGNDENFCSELVHIYCLSPLRDAGEAFDRQDYREAVAKILAYYKREKMDRIENFSLLSHFYAYVMEGLYDLGEVDLCRSCMERLGKFRNSRGGIPGLNNVPWVCSTGMFQLALVWYKLGELDRGNSLFYYALSLQNKSGGWYGSYPAPGMLAKFYRGRKRPYYFPDAEISWAVKYFLDALAMKERLEFEKMAPMLIRKLQQELPPPSRHRTCDVGCGKGRYLKGLIRDCPDNEYFATDISSNVMSDMSFLTDKRVGSMTNIPYDDGMFDFVYACESFEHAVNTRAAFRELHRITKPGGTFAIIDKPIEKLGRLEIYEWEQWIDDSDIKRWADELGCGLEIVRSVPYEGRDDGLFRAWIARKK